MKFCINCGKEIKEGAKFCPFCGSEQPVVRRVAPEIAEQIHSPEQSQRSSTSKKKHKTSAGKTQNESQTMEKIQETFGEKIIRNEKIRRFTKGCQNYFFWLNQNVKEPKISIAPSKPSFGAINYLIISLLSALIFSHSILKAVDVNSNSSFPLVFEAILIHLLFFLIPVLLVYLLGDKMYKSPTTLLEVFGKVYGPVSLVIYLVLFTFIYSFIIKDSTKLLIFLWLTPFIFIQFSFSGNVWLSEDMTKNKNKFYYSTVIFLISILSLYFVFILFDSMILSKFMASFELINLFDVLLN